MIQLYFFKSRSWRHFYRSQSKIFILPTPTLGRNHRTGAPDHKVTLASDLKGAGDIFKKKCMVQIVDSCIYSFEQNPKHEQFAQVNLKFKSCVKNVWDLNLWEIHFHLIIEPKQLNTTKKEIAGSAQWFLRKSRLNEGLTSDIAYKVTPLLIGLV